MINKRIRPIKMKTIDKKNERKQKVLSFILKEARKRKSTVVKVNVTKKLVSTRLTKYEIEKVRSLILIFLIIFYNYDHA